MKALNIVVFSLVLATLVFAESDAVRWQNIASSLSRGSIEQIVPVVNQKGDRQKERDEKDGDDSTFYKGATLTLSALTLAVLIFQAIIFRDQKTLMRSQFLASHRPTIKVRNFYLTATNEPHPFNNTFRGQFTLVNVGGNSAHDVECSVWVDWRGNKLPMMRPYDGVDPNERLTRKLIVAGGKETILFDDADSLSDHSSIRNASEIFCSVMGYVDYADEFGHRYRTAFCRTHDQSEGRFIKSANGDYEHEE